MAIKPVSGEIKAQVINDNLSYLDSQISSVSIGPFDTYTSLSALQTAYPNGRNGFAVVLEADGKTGYMYTWNGTTWKKGGLAQAMGIADGTVTQDKASPIVQTGFFIPNNGVIKIDFNTTTGVLTIPAGQFFYANKPFIVNATSIDKSNVLVSNTYVYLVFLKTSSTFDLMTRAEFIASSEREMVFCGFVKLDVETSDIRIPFSLNGEKPNNEKLTKNEVLNDYVTGVTKPAHYVPSTLNATMTLDTVTKTLTVKAGDVFQGYTRHYLGNHTTDVSHIFADNLSKKCLLLFDLATKKFTIQSITSVTNNTSQNFASFGLFDLATKLGNLTIPLVVDGVAIKNVDLYNNRTITTTIEPVSIDFIRKKIIIPRFTRIIDDAISVQPSLFTFDMLAGEQIVFYRHSTRAFGLVAKDSPNLTGDITTVLYLNADTGAIKTDYDYVINGSPSQNFIGVPNYAVQRIDEINDEIAETKDKNMLTFAFITDSHGDSRHFNNLVHFSKYGLCDFFVHGGDINIAESDKKYVRNYYNQCQLALSKIKEPVYVTQGNHDQDGANGSDVGTMPSGEFANRFILSQKQNKNVIFPDDENSGYYYVDDEKRKVRIVVSNSTKEPYGVAKRWGFDKLQMQWLANVAFDLSGKTDWHLLFVSHHNLSASLTLDGSYATNGDNVLAMLKAFKNGDRYENTELEIDVDFISPKNLIGTLCGHVHADNLYLDADLGFYQISTTCSQTSTQNTSATNGEKPTRELGTISEDAWDVFCIDTLNKSVKIKRFGAGNDRAFNY